MPQAKKHKKVSKTGNHLLFMPRLYDETMHILLDAQHYFTSYGADDQRHLNGLQKLIYSSEMSRITLRLSTIMAWILARRALHEGQLTMQEILTSYRLQFEDVCLVASDRFETILPSYVMHLHDKSLSLYSRILALDNVESQTHSA